MTEKKTDPKEEIQMNLMKAKDNTSLFLGVYFLSSSGVAVGGGAARARGRDGL